MNINSVDQADLQQQHGQFPLSPLQQAYWFGAQPAFDLHVATHTYYEFHFPNISVDIPRLQQAFNRLIERHEALRSVITNDGLMEVLKKVELYRIRRLDLSPLPDSEARQRLNQKRRGLIRADIDFTRWPCFQLLVTHMPGADVVHFNFSPMFTDGRGVSTLFHELSQFYADPQCPPQASTFSYAAYASHREQAKSAGPYLKARKYWFARLETLPPGPELPWAARSQPMRSRLNHRRRYLPANVWNAVKSAAAAHKLGLTALMLTLYGAVVAHWSKSKHFTLTMLIQNRDKRFADQQAVASFSSTLLLELDFRQPRVLIDQVKAVQKQLFMDLMHAGVCGLELLQARNRAQHMMARAGSPVAFVSNLEVLEDAARDNDMFHRNGRYLHDCHLETPQVILDHQVAETQDGRLALNWDAMDEALYPGVADAMLYALQQLLFRLARAPRTFVDPVSVPLPPAQAVMMEKYNRTQTPLAEQRLHRLVEPQLRTGNERTALTYTVEGKTVQISFRQLNVCAMQTRFLLTQGESLNGQVIAVFMPKCWQQVAAVLAITGTGAAYLPIDPDLPAARIRLLLQRCDVKTVLICEPQARHPALAGLQKVIVRLHEDMPDSATAATVDFRDIAYIIFTSGSTGTPKGVALDHRGPANTIQDINRKFAIGPRDRVFAISALSFDLSVYDIFGMLAAGGGIVIPDPDHLRDPQHWLEMLQRHQVTVWNSAPPLMQMLVEYCRDTGRALPDCLRVIMLSGDWIPTWLPGAIKQWLPNASIFSLGGATEASIWSIYYPIGHVDPSWSSIPYGVPLANQSMHVFDDNLEPRPVAVSGDLYIGGIGLAKGYWRDAQTSADSFITHPRTGERLYRTGDKGRMLANGNIEFQGREDSQVKLRGYRVELGEIESVLQRHESVNHAVVVVHGSDHGRGHERLVAYVAGPHPVSAESLKTHAGKHLPAYMVPALIMFMEQLPVTSNGKVDRKRLPSPDDDAALASQVERPSRNAVAVNTETEKQLARIWMDILNLAEEPAANVSFFDAGGQSFLSVRLMAKIRRRLGVALPLAMLIETDTIAGLAAAIDASRGGESPGGAGDTDDSPLVLLSGGEQPENRPVFLVHPVGGNVLCYRDFINQLQSLRQPFYGLQAITSENTESPPSLPSMARTYLAAIGKHHTGPYAIGGWSMGGVLAAEMARQLIEAGETVSHLFMLDAPAPLHQVMPDATACMRWFFRDLSGQEPGWMSRYLQSVAAARQNPGWPSLLRYALNHGYTPPGSGFDEVDALYHLFLNNLTALRGYHAQVVHGLNKVWIARARQQAVAELDDHPAVADEAWGWRPYLRGEVSVDTIEGNHYSLWDADNMPSLRRKFLQWYRP